MASASANRCTNEMLVPSHPGTPAMTMFEACAKAPSNLAGQLPQPVQCAPGWTRHDSHEQDRLLHDCLLRVDVTPTGRAVRARDPACAASIAILDMREVTASVQVAHQLLTETNDRVVDALYRLPLAYLRVMPGSTHQQARDWVDGRRPGSRATTRCCAWIPSTRRPCSPDPPMPGSPPPASLDRVEARLEAERGRILHARFLST